MEEVKKYLKENCISMVLLAAIFVGLFALMIHNCILDFDAGMNLTEGNMPQIMLIQGITQANHFFLTIRYRPVRR